MMKSEKKKMLLVLVYIAEHLTDENSSYYGSLIESIIERHGHHKKHCISKLVKLITKDIYKTDNIDLINEMICRILSAKKLPNNYEEAEKIFNEIEKGE